MSILPTLITILILIFFNGFYVAAEFATVSARKGRIFQQSENGNKAAKSLFKILNDAKELDAYVAICQVGITISSLVLGFVGQAYLSPGFAIFLDDLGVSIGISNSTLSITIVLTVLSIFQVLFGELIPKNIGMQFPEKYSLLLLKPIQYSGIIFKPLISLFNGSGLFLMKIFKLSSEESHAHIHSPEEIGLLIDASAEGGLIAEEGKLLLKNTFSFRNIQIRKVMIPRSEMLSSPQDISYQELLQKVSNSQYSRIPIYKDSIDEIIGSIHLRDLVKAVGKNEHNQILKIEDIHPISYFPELMAVKDVFNSLQKEKIQMAIILDEFAGTIGMVTLEDLLEELFGELQDEFDPIDNKLMPSKFAKFSGETQIDFINNTLGLDLQYENVDTIGGLLIEKIGFIPKVDKEPLIVVVNKHKFQIEKMNGPRIIEISYISPTPKSNKSQ